MYIVQCPCELYYILYVGNSLLCIVLCVSDCIAIVLLGLYVVVHGYQSCLHVVHVSAGMHVYYVTVAITSQAHLLWPWTTPMSTQTKKELSILLLLKQTSLSPRALLRTYSHACLYLYAFTYVHCWVMDEQMPYVYAFYYMALCDHIVM